MLVGLREHTALRSVTKQSESVRSRDEQLGGYDGFRGDGEERGSFPRERRRAEGRGRRVCGQSTINKRPPIHHIIHIK